MNLSKLMRPIAVAIIIAPLLAGCGGSSNTNSVSGNTQLSTSSQMSDGLTAVLAQNHAVISAGGTVAYTVSLVNNTAQSISYRPQRSSADVGVVPASLRIVDVNGNLVYPRNVTNTSPPPPLGAATALNPGQSVSGSVTVGNTDAGRFSSAEQYYATASFTVATSDTNSTGIVTSVGPLILQAQ